MLTPRKPSGREVHLKAHKWTTIAVGKGLRPKRLHVEVWAPRTASWRRIGIIPGFGRFKQFLNVRLSLGIIQVKIRENRTCTVSTYRGPTVQPSEHHHERVEV